MTTLQFNPVTPAISASAGAKPASTETAEATFTKLGKQLSQEPRLQGKVAVVTGAGSGLGQATAMLYAQHGAKIVVVDRDQ